MQMYGKANTLEDVFEFLLEQFSLDAILEMNDLTEVEVLTLLFNEGLITQPERSFQKE